jgi:hypothetical protein
VLCAVKLTATFTVSHAWQLLGGMLVFLMMDLAFHSGLQGRIRRRSLHQREGCYALEMKMMLSSTIMVCMLMLNQIQT